MTTEYLVLDNECLGYRDMENPEWFGILRSHRAEDGIAQNPVMVRMGFHSLRPATAQDFAHYHVYLSEGIKSELRPPLHDVLVQYLQGKKDLSGWNTEVCMRALVTRASEYAWAAKCKSTFEVLEKAGELVRTAGENIVPMTYCVEHRYGSFVCRANSREEAIYQALLDDSQMKIKSVVLFGSEQVRKVAQ